MSNAQAIQDAEEDIIQQFVTFQVGTEHFGLPMRQVAEIIRLPATVSVPLTPESLVGLANLRGNVLPVLDLRHILGVSAQNLGESTRVLVVDMGSTVGLIVDSVSKAMRIDEQNIKDATSLKTTVSADLLNGVIQDDERLIQLIDIRQVIDRDFAKIIAMATDNHTSVTNNDASIIDIEEDDFQNHQLVSFLVDQEEYAFDLMDVEEIVRAPDDIAEIPDTAAHILGMINLRGRLLPLLSLRALFGFPERDLDEHSRVLVISIRAPGGGQYSMGLVVDDVREVLVVPESERDPVPKLIHEEHDEIAAVCRLNNGNRLLSILKPEALFDEQALQAITMNQGMESHNMNSSHHAVTENNEEDNDTQMVVFKLANQEFGVTIDYVQEITRVPETMSQVPKTADFIEGMINLRGTILPVLDMRSRFGLERMAPNERQRIIVLNINNVQTGFIMDSVVEVLRLSRDSIEPAPELSEDQTRVMGRVVNLREEKRIIQVLNADELLNPDENNVLLELDE